MGRNKKEIEGKSPFHLRSRQLKDGRMSLFIDYFKDGRHEYEFLKLYLSPETSENNRRENLKTLRIAENIVRAKRLQMLQTNKDNDGNINLNEMRLIDFIDILIIQNKKEGKAGYKNLKTSRSNLQKFDVGCRLNELDENFCISYYTWLRNECKTISGRNLSAMTVYVYFRKFGVILSKAYRMGYLKENLWIKVDKKYKLSEPYTEKRFLTLEELKKLEVTPYYIYSIVREAFLFSCFTGLRFSDIRNLKWDNIKFIDTQCLICLNIQKTQNPLTFPLSDKAYSYLPPKKKNQKLVFNGLPSPAQTLFHLNKWVASAGIKDRIHFHTARHTFATLLLTAGSDIYTTSNLLGHSDIRVTQKYAKIIDKKKQDAINLLDSFIENNEIKRE